MKMTVEKRRRVILLMIAAAAICAAIVFWVFYQNGNRQKSPIVYLTENNELVYRKHPWADAVLLSSFGSSADLNYYNNDEDCVFYSSDGQTLYFLICLRDFMTMVALRSAAWTPLCLTRGSLRPG